ncbi:MAG TPA: zf-HC2 domain-containing protein, partial [Vicinamibacterales bacterium]|nr:zf-HC2 domain-containing protein [Vicinamibacterales bacterium]
MPGCEAFEVRVSALVDGELDAVERARVEAHLEACAACRSLLADLRELRQRAARLEARRPPPDLWPRIAAALDVAR